MVTSQLVSKSDRDRIMSDIGEAIEWLSGFGADPSGGVTRLLYSKEWLSAQKALAQHMEASGLHVCFDDCGNLYGRLEGEGISAGTLLTGSHVDTVKSGGKYDGAYGILAGIIALKYLRDNYGAPKVSLEVVSLCEEEGSRFPLTYWGSGNITGKYSLERVPDIRDRDGVELEQAMLSAGFGKGTYRSPRRHDVLGFIELHIEQGSLLERESRSIGIVNHIVGQRRYTVKVSGTANHAGTTPMDVRKDALAGACAMIQKLEEAARLEGGQFVATTGLLNVSPNLPNVIAGEVAFTVDVRDANADTLERFCREFHRCFKEIADSRELHLQIQEWMNEPPVPMHAPFNETLRNICEEYNYSYRFMNSGAGHDSQLFQAVCPTALAFVPNKDGVSHSPLEFSDPGSLADGIVTLIEWLYFYGYKGGELA
ncbi:Zn-dependent hydrolase [Paenibacillus alkalitolerans]|uniref:Zn-dependent hydrolase n=1 Tax=Paenibacillus alkalitolerans TaxID=2799335 RepID=UPI0018F5E8F9|nr:Zn-dependent hydrolase [Paenibacillus alkalitolerans]